jgi:predicted transcriptional regulator
MATGKRDEMVAVNVLVPKDLKELVDGIAAENDWTLATVVRRALKEYVERTQPKKAKR